MFSSNFEISQVWDYPVEHFDNTSDSGCDQVLFGEFQKNSKIIRKSYTLHPDKPRSFPQDFPIRLPPSHDPFSFFRVPNLRRLSELTKFPE